MENQTAQLPIFASDRVFENPAMGRHLFELDEKLATEAIQNGFWQLAFANGRPVPFRNKIGERTVRIEVSSTLDEMIFQWRLEECASAWRRATIVSKTHERCPGLGAVILKVNFVVDDRHTSVEFQTPYGRLEICNDPLIFRWRQIVRLNGRRLSYSIFKLPFRELIAQLETESFPSEEEFLRDAESVLSKNIRDIVPECAKFVKKHQELLRTHAVEAIHEQ